MKAAVMYSKDDLKLVNLPEPAPQNEDEILVTVKAVAIKHFDRGRAMGRHYSTSAANSEGKVIGGDGICLLQDGSRVYAIGAGGMLAEKATIDKDRIVKIPDNLDDATAAALPNAVIGSAMGLKYKAGIQKGDTVLINGATGFTGRIAVQIAKHYGAKTVIATGRNQQSLNDLLSLGADQVINIGNESFETQLKNNGPIDIIIDYLWGPTAEVILNTLKGNGSFTNKVRYVSVGSMTGDIIRLSAANLRSVDLQLTGSGLGAWTRSQVASLFKEILPEMFQLAAEGKLKIKTTTIMLEDIEKVWDENTPDGRRLVVLV